MDPTQLAHKVSIESDGEEAYVVCTKPIAPGEVLFKVTGRLVSRPDRYSVQLAARRHVTPDGAPWSLVNHSCEPNARLDCARQQIIALRPILLGNEVSWNYLTTEWELISPFHCTCASELCVGYIQGFKHLRLPSRQLLLPLLSPFLQLRLLYELPPVSVESEGRRRP